MLIGGVAMGQDFQTVKCPIVVSTNLSVSNVVAVVVTNAPKTVWSHSLAPARKVSGGTSSSGRRPTRPRKRLGD